MYFEGGSANLQAKEFVAMEYEHRAFFVDQCAVLPPAASKVRG